MARAEENRTAGADADCGRGASHGVTATTAARITTAMIDPASRKRRVPT